MPEERNGHGAVGPLPLVENGLLSAWKRKGFARGGLVRRGAVAAFAREVVARFDVRTAGVEHAASSLSGGNLQKFIVGREIALRPTLLLVAQPTWGVDVGASAFIRQALIDLSRAGAGVLVVSEELDELFEICDRLHVMYGGRLSGPLSRAEATPERVGLLMAGRTETTDSRPRPEVALAGQG